MFETLKKHLGLTQHTAVISVTPAETPKDNTPLSRRINRMIRVKKSMDNLKEGPKYDQLKAEYDANLKELQENSDALKFLNELLSK